MSEPNNEIKDMEQPEVELTPEQAEAVGGGASDYLLDLEGVKGESKATTTPTRIGITKAGTGTLA
jgi:hypothetical protein